MLAACTPEDGGTGLSAIHRLGGTSSAVPARPIEPLSGPSVVANPMAGLTAWLDLSLPDARALRVTVSNADRAWTVEDAPAVDHHVLLTGLRAGVEHPIAVEALDGRGRVSAVATLAYTPPPLPEDFDELEVRAADPDEMEPGVTLIGLGSYLTAIDPQGFPIWYVPIDGAVHEANRLADGDLYVVVDRQTAIVLDLSGATRAAYVAARTFDVPPGSIPVDVAAIHHDVIELPNGDLAGLSIERRRIRDYPSSESDPSAPPQAAWVAGDVVVEFTRDGDVVREVPLLDRLDPHRIAYDGVTGNYWEDFRPWRGDDVKDWSHANAISYDEETGTMLVGLRHQDAVVGLDWDSGELAWILGPTGTWPDALEASVLAPDQRSFGFPYHEHGAKFGPDGTVLLFDNGNNRASAYERKLPDQRNYSRAVELAIDPERGSWRPRWSWGQDLVPSHYSGSLGDVDALPSTGDVLVTFGNIADPVAGGVEVDEVRRDGAIVWQLLVHDADETTFRSERLAGLFPGL